MIPDVKNAVIQKGACRACDDCWTVSSNKNWWFPKYKDYPSVKGGKEGNGNEEHINIPKALDERPINSNDLVSPCKITFKFWNNALKYAQYQFEDIFLNKNKILEYLRTWCFSRNVAFNAIEAFHQGQEYQGPDVWKKYEEFVMDILDFAETPRHLLYLCIKKYILSMIPTLLRQDWDRTNTLEGWQASLWIIAEQMLLTGAVPTNSPTKMDKLVSKTGLSHNQAFTGFSFQFTIILIAYWMKTNRNATVIYNLSNYKFFGIAWLVECSQKRTHYVKK